MSQEKARKEFEDWAEGELGLPLRKVATGDYQSFGMSMAWKAWNASRAKVGVDLPEGIETSIGPVLKRYEAVEAIEAAGLKVKP